MHGLVRQVRFSVNPFLDEQLTGANSYASKPAGEGLAVFFELAVELAGEVDRRTGFVINVSEIDTNVREYAVPVFCKWIKRHFQDGEHINFFQVAEILKTAWQRLEDKFVTARLAGLSLKLNPFRKIRIDSKEFEMIYFSERFEFAATHKLWNEGFSDERNFQVFGKCANPAGHGHNYIIEVTVKAPAGQGRVSVGDFEKVVDEEFVRLLDHKNLNVDVGYFSENIPSMENIAVFAWERMADKFEHFQLHCVTVWETDRTYCSYYGK
ncbi:MAG: 6-carboxytetrahydropterin synthase [Planctomycetota bacterium]|jgi:6-pyruvoyltetrahydropterin/6-carboxytetrahydropterin synthase